MYWQTKPELTLVERNPHYVPWVRLDGYQAPAVDDLATVWRSQHSLAVEAAKQIAATWPAPAGPPIEPGRYLK